MKNSRSRDRKCVSKGKTVQDSECYKKGNGQSIELEDCQRQCAGKHGLFEKKKNLV